MKRIICFTLIAIFFASFNAQAQESVAKPAKKQKVAEITFESLDYDNKIILVLKEAGDRGLSVQKIARHVFNASNSFFETIEFEEIRRYVQNYLLKNSKSSDSLFEKVGPKGVYRINPNSAEMQQLMLLFTDETDEAEKPSIDLSLSLF